jgi:hypothetical protein
MRWLNVGEDEPAAAKEWSGFPSLATLRRSDLLGFLVNRGTMVRVPALAFRVRCDRAHYPRNEGRP